MSWKFAGISFEENFGGSYPALLSRLNLDYRRSAEGFTFADAIARDNQRTALGIVNGKTALLNHLLPYDCAYEAGQEGRLDQLLKLLSLGGGILNYIFDGVSGTYCFSLFSAGKRVRRWAAEPGNVWVDEGQPIAGEVPTAPKRPATDDALPAIFASSEDEARLFAVWEAFLGVAFQAFVRDDRPLFHVFFGQ